jgi:hypothetical protein
MSKFPFFEPTKKSFLIVVIAILASSFTFWLGFFVRAKIQPRSVLMLNKCQDRCWSANEITGLIGSIGIELGGQK